MPCFDSFKARLRLLKRKRRLRKDFKGAPLRSPDQRARDTRKPQGNVTAVGPSQAKKVETHGGETIDHLEGIDALGAALLTQTRARIATDDESDIKRIIDATETVDRRVDGLKGATDARRHARAKAQILVTHALRQPAKMSVSVGANVEEPQ